MALGKNVQKYRLNRELSQEALSLLTNGVVSQGVISALEKRDSTSSKYLAHLAKAFKVSESELLSGEPGSSVVLTKEQIEWLALRDRLNEEDRKSVFAHGSALAEQPKQKHSGAK